MLGIELRTPNCTMMRIQGEIGPELYPKYNQGVQRSNKDLHRNGKPVEDNNRYIRSTIPRLKTVDDKWVRKDRQKWRSGNPYSNDFLRYVSTSLCVLAYTQKVSFILSDPFQRFQESIFHFAHLLAEFHIGSGRLAYFDAEN